MKCFVCDKQLKEYGHMHPDGAIHFLSYGHYGTTVFDPMDGSTINVFICDHCLRKKFQNAVILELKK